VYYVPLCTPAYFHASPVSSLHTKGTGRGQTPRLIARRFVPFSCVPALAWSHLSPCARFFRGSLSVSGMTSSFFSCVRLLFKSNLLSSLSIDSATSTSESIVVGEMSNAREKDRPPPRLSSCVSSTWHFAWASAFLVQVCRYFTRKIYQLCTIVLWSVKDFLKSCREDFSCICNSFCHRIRPRVPKQNVLLMLLRRSYKFCMHSTLLFPNVTSLLACWQDWQYENGITTLGRFTIMGV
jgi:hypothetical protein